MKIEIDQRLLDADVAGVTRSMAAMRRTVTEPGTGEVLVSRRKKAPWESRKPAHGRAVANFLRSRGMDPFDYGAEREAAVGEWLASQVQRLVQLAHRTGRSQERRIREAILQAAEQLAAIARERIARGEIGSNTPRYRQRKERLARRGLATRKYGTPPPAGVLTGRFIEGIRARWRLGRRTRRG